MPSPFEILESYVTISERGADEVLAKITAIQAELLATPNQHTITFTDTGLDDIRRTFDQFDGSNRARIDVDGLDDIVNDLAIIDAEIVKPRKLDIDADSLAPPIIATKTLADNLKRTSDSADDVKARFKESLGLDDLQKRAVAVDRDMAALNETVNRTTSISTAAALGVTGLVAAITLFATSVELERAPVITSIEQVTNDAREATELIQQLEQFTEDFGRNFNEAAEQAQRLTALTGSTEQVVENMTSIGNVAAAVSGNFNGIAKAFTDIQTKGRLAGQELNQLANQNVPLVTELADMLGVTRAQVIELAKDGAISADTVTEAFDRMGGAGGRWENAMLRQAETVGGSWARITAAAENLADGLGIGDRLSAQLKIIADSTTSATRAIRGLSFDDAEKEAIQFATVGERQFRIFTAVKDLLTSIGATKVLPDFEVVDINQIAAAGSEVATQNALLQEQEAQRLVEIADRIRDQIASPEEKKIEALKELESVYGETNLTAEEYQRRIDQIGETYERALQSTSAYRAEQEKLRETERQLKIEERERQQILDQAVSFQQSLETPIETFRREVEEMVELFGQVDSLTAENLERGIARAAEQLGDAVDNAKELQRVTRGTQASSIVFGSVQEYNVRIREDVRSPTVVATEEVAQLQAEANSILANIQDTHEQQLERDGQTIELPVAEIDGV